MKTEDVVRAWLDRKSKRTSNGSISTDGIRLFSYKLEIGRYDSSDDKFVIWYYKAPNQFISTTTSKHVSLTISVANQVLGDLDDSYWVMDPFNG
jgi:hypothetical protein